MHTYSHHSVFSPNLLTCLFCIPHRTAHSTCLARWQLQSAGSRRETHCEFCDRALPDWKSTLTPPHCGVNAPAIMNVNFDGRTYSFEVKPGPDGYTSFTESIRRAFSLPEDSELNITFTCDEPSTDSGSLLTLQGSGAYDAAVHCASVSAARRMATPSPSRTNSLDSTLLDRAIESLPSIEAPLTPGQSAADPRQLDAGGKRRWVGIGKRLKTALSDFVTVRQP